MCDDSSEVSHFCRLEEEDLVVADEAVEVLCCMDTETWTDSSLGWSVSKNRTCCPTVEDPGIFFCDQMSSKSRKLLIGSKKKNVCQCKSIIILCKKIKIKKM